MRNDNKKSVIVGVFVLIGIIIFIAGVLTMGGQQKKFVRSIKLNMFFNENLLVLANSKYPRRL
jgi:phospholipid/cholesterol/gamma-HCH transport system substrate-binding protein